MCTEPYPRSWKRPESVLVVVYTAGGEVLLMERTQPAGYWQSVTGSLRWDELPSDAAARELAEETGLLGYQPVDSHTVNRFTIHPAWRTRYAPDVIENVEHVFTLRLSSRFDILLNPAEHSRCEWLERDAALARVSSATNRAAIAQHVVPRNG